MFSASVNYSYGQTIQDLSCSGCVQIENSDQLQIHRLLELPIILWAEDYAYTFDHNSKIIINGHSNLNNPDVPIIFTVTNPIGNVVTIDQVMIPSNSDFEIEFNPSGPLWKADGMYIIKAQAGPQSTIFKTNVNLFSTDEQSRFECNSDEITVSGDNGGQYCVPFNTSTPVTEITGFLNTGTKTLSVNVVGSFNQILDIDIDRKLLDAKSPDGAATEFVVMLNGQPADYEENDSPLAGHRTLRIFFDAGENSIEIVGTSVIPEFGSFAVLIFVVAIISIVILSNKKINLVNSFSKF